MDIVFLKGGEGKNKGELEGCEVLEIILVYYGVIKRGGSGVREMEFEFLFYY